MRINESPFQVDKSTNVNKAKRLVFVQSMFLESVQEDMLGVLLLSTNTTAAELFRPLDYISAKPY